MLKSFLGSCVLSLVLVGCGSSKSEPFEVSSLTALGGNTPTTTPQEVPTQDPLETISLPQYIATSIVLPSQTNNGTALAWEISHDAAYSLQNHTIMIHNQEEKKCITLSVHALANPDVSKTFTLTLLPTVTKPSEKIEQDIKLLDNLLKNINTEIQTNAHYTLPSTGFNGSDIEWKSCDKTSITIENNDLSLINPQDITTAKKISLQATLHNGSCSKKAYFTLLLSPNQDEPQGVTLYAYALLGNLANADVSIYAITDIDTGDREKLWQEQTSSGTLLSDIGKFNNHQDGIEDNQYYLYDIAGGEDWDSNDDGIKDNQSTPNKGHIRALILGKDVKDLGNNFKVTWLSELLLEITLDNTSQEGRTLDNIQAALDKSSQLLLKDDLNHDGVISALDVYMFNPVSDTLALREKYQTMRNTISDYIHAGKSPVEIFSHVSEKIEYRYDYEIRTEYSYNQYGDVSQTIVHNLMERPNPHTCTFSYLYNESHILLKKSKTCNLDPVEEVSWRYFYNADGTIQKELYDYDNDSQADEITFYHYDANGKIIQRDIDNGADGSIDYSNTYENIYDENNHLIESHSDSLTYSYDQYERLIEVYGGNHYVFEQYTYKNFWGAQNLLQ